MADEFVVISEVDGLQMIEYLDDDAEWSAWAVAEERANRELGKCEEAIALEEEAA